MMTSGCQCACHNGPHYACDVPGGCGSTGCGRTGTRTANACVTCAVYRPDAEPRQPNHPPVCDGDRTLLDRHLVDVANLHAELVNGEPPEADRRRYERFGVQYNDDGTREIVSLGEAWADPLTAFGGVAPIPSRSKQPSVAGSRERPVPIRVDVVDLTADAREPNPTSQSRRFPDDQVGHLAVATVLDQRVRDWRHTLFPDQHLPAARVDELTIWLRHRADLACDHHPAITEFAAELKQIRGALAAAAGQAEPRPEPCEGVACSRCDLLALFRRPGDTYRAECGGCGQLYSEQEYTELTAGQAKTERASRTPEQIHVLLRRH